MASRIRLAKQHDDPPATTEPPATDQPVAEEPLYYDDNPTVRAVLDWYVGEHTRTRMQKNPLWTEQEYRLILRKSRAYARRLIVFIRYSALRPEQVRILKWCHVRMEENTIAVHDHVRFWKRKAPCRVPLNPVLVKLIHWLRRNTPANAMYVFVNTKGRPWERYRITDLIEEGRLRAGISDNAARNIGRHRAN